mgnify:FL=1
MLSLIADFIIPVLVIYVGVCLIFEAYSEFSAGNIFTSIMLVISALYCISLPVRDYLIRKDDKH